MLEYITARRGATPGPGPRRQAWDLPRHLNVHQFITDDEKMDSHFTKDSYRKIAGFLCATIGGGQKSSCVPPGWRP
jgi:hypothetical protein